MINLAELSSYEKLEDLCEELLYKKGLTVRRLGRGPGQLGKDILAEESFVGSLSAHKKIWMVEVKFTKSGKSISEKDVFNITDRVRSQKADGYLLFTNARLSVNLEKTLNSINNSCTDINVIIWNEIKIVSELLNNPILYRKYFPDSFKKFICDNRSYFIVHSKTSKSPLTYILASLRLLKGLYGKPNSYILIDSTIKNLEIVSLSIINDIDSFCKLFDEE